MLKCNNKSFQIDSSSTTMTCKQEKELHNSLKLVSDMDVEDFAL
jgi:hypothetical protein